MLLDSGRYRARVYGRWLAGIAGSNPLGSMDVYFDCPELLGTGLCDGRITRPVVGLRSARAVEPWRGRGGGIVKLTLDQRSCHS